MVHSEYPNIFSPIKIGPVTLKNRILYAPMSPCLAGPESGAVTAETVAYFAQQAKSGAGLCNTGITPVDDIRARDAWSNISVLKDSDVPDLAKIADTVHEHGSKICCELCHSGMNANPRSLKAKAFVPSLIEGQDPEHFEEISREQIEEVIQNFCNAAGRLKLAGFDMIQVHAGHGNLVSAFFSNYWNHRTDEYGGSLENRMRFTLTLLRRLRETVGPDMALDMRISGYEYCPNCPTEDEVVTFVNRCAEYLDMVNFSGGSATPEGSDKIMCSYLQEKNIHVELVSRLKPRIKIPCSVVGNIQTIDDAEKIIADGTADMVTLGRTLLADSEFAKKAYQHHAEDIRPCLRCSMCGVRPFYGFSVRCAVNPQLGRESMRMVPALAKRKVLIAGGGPSGMTAAQILVKRGFDVTLCEASSELGGRLHEASAMKEKDTFRSYFRWIVRQTEKCGAKIRLDTKVTPELVRSEKPDVLFLAIGAQHIHPPIRGIEKAQSMDITEAELRKKPIGKNVVIVGAGPSGTELSVTLGEEGHTVTVVDMLREDQLLTNYFPNIPYRLKAMQRQYGITALYETKVEELTDHSVFVDTKGEKKEIPCDSVVLAVGLKPDQKILDALRDIVPETYLLGDCEHVADIMAANESAYITAMELE